MIPLSFVEETPAERLAFLSLSKNLSLRASARREASALGVQTGAAIRFQNA